MKSTNTDLNKKIEQQRKSLEKLLERIKNTSKNKQQEKPARIEEKQNIN